MKNADYFVIACILATRRGLSALKDGVDKILDSDIFKMEKNKK